MEHSESNATKSIFLTKMRNYCDCLKMQYRNVEHNSTFRYCILRQDKFCCIVLM